MAIPVLTIVWDAMPTTVVGLVVSAIGFVTQQVKERWAMKNLAILEFVAQTVVK